MDQFGLYLELGFSHILDLNAYDHLLFVVLLSIGFGGKNYKQIFWLVTAFTIGHSITLALATLKVISVNANWVEFFIPLTICATAIFNLFAIDKESGRRINTLYGLILLFGLIHGLGFSGYLQAILGIENNIFLPLMAFNVGIEMGQIVIILCFLLLRFLFFKIFTVREQNFSFFLNTFILGLATSILIKNFPL
jgi:hypothetical protein